MESGMAGLAEKLGITLGHIVCLLNAPTLVGRMCKRQRYGPTWWITRSHLCLWKSTLRGS
jgi:hypothetical protein